MVNSVDFSKRLQKIMDRNDLNASSFAERIDVGRSSISHILSGRNKPSLDFVMSTVKEFPEVDLYWLLNGKGSYPKEERTEVKTPPNTKSAMSDVSKTAEPISKIAAQPPVPDLFHTPIPDREKEITSDNKGKNIQKVILLYDDGSFEYFIP